MARRSLRQIRRALGMFEDLIFPPICGGCRARGSWLCDACRRDLELIPRPICARCGQVTDQVCDACPHCAAWPDEIGEVRAAFAFGGPIRDTIHRYKYQGEFARASSLGGLMLEAIERPEFDAGSRWGLVAYVPLHVRRRRQRGFDQAMLLARNLSERLDLPCTSELKRVVDTPTQVGRGVAERQTNVLDAFGWVGVELTGVRVLIVDDVVTTGSTMIAASKPLIHAGAARVDGIAIAREIFH